MKYQGNYPKTKDEWWILVDQNWPDLLGILNRFIGMTDNEDINGNITECQRSEEIARMKQKRDSRLVRYFNGAWLNAPDIPEIHEIPGWSLLCDLCSEEYVLYKKEENYNEL